MKKMSKFMSLLMVLIMLSMLVPVSALAADNEEFAATEDNAIKIVLVTKEAAAEDAIVTDDPVIVEEPLVTDEIVVPAESSSDTAVVPEQPATTEINTAAVPDESIVTQMASYLYLMQNDVMIDVIAANTGADYSYDAAANQLTLNNFVGENMFVLSPADTFKLLLLGTNILRTDSGFAVNVYGNMNSSGTGTLIAEGLATENLMGGGINVIGNLVIDSGSYGIVAAGFENSSSAVGILTGYNDDIITPGNLTINGGTIDIAAYNSDIGGAFGLFAFGDLIVNGGNIDIFTNSPTSYSRGIGAYDKLVFNGGNTTVDSITDTGFAEALYSYNTITINNGILDLYTSGASANALVAEGGIYINPSYGDVDLNASSLYLEPLVTKDFKQPHYSSSNPKTGVDTTAMDALVAGIMIFTLIGFSFAASKRGAKA
ncbi:hypothetical protein [Acetobacterium bakii]|uniref:Gram-positive cocci surface proteins LPxTG domain-containing protein n=1 Tax=Acetobacterium bakii TaxID=52689 RepID=A0A0L6U2Y3_9FIRM|nr:hypothetical protein [Acetobacterium bakii]KNZ42727.1 hypothetical protein AKG39_04640 [Acetobacterium bakii]